MGHIPLPISGLYSVNRRFPAQRVFDVLTETDLIGISPKSFASEN